MENISKKLLASQPEIIRVSRFQPFDGRVGIDTVVKLEFAYDALLIARLKGLLGLYSYLSPFPAAGGWVRFCKSWFVEPEVWPTIRAELQLFGYVIENEEAQP